MSLDSSWTNPTSSTLNPTQQTYATATATDTTSANSIHTKVQAWNQGSIPPPPNQIPPSPNPSGTESGVSLKELQEELRTLTAQSTAEQRAHRTEVDQINDTLKAMTESVKTQQQQLSDHGREIRAIKHLQAAQTNTLKEILLLLSNKQEYNKTEETLSRVLDAVTQSQTSSPPRSNTPIARHSEDDSNQTQTGNEGSPNSNSTHRQSSPPRGGAP